MVARTWKKHGLQPHRIEYYKASNDPDFEKKAAEIIGLYMNPPQHAAVFCIDEKTAIQALDRRDPILPLSPGRAERHGFEYVRHGTLSLYAAFDTKTGEVLGKTVRRHTSQEFVAFLEQLVANHKRKREIHVILDNLSAHKTAKVAEFLEANPKVRLHFTPTYSSWLNKVELWFSKIERDLIHRGVFTSTHDLTRKIMRYIRKYNEDPKPVKWTYNDPSRRINPLNVQLLQSTSWLYWSSGQAQQIDSLAVLPFENESEDPDTQYLIDGIAESLIVSLSQLHELKVISRGAAFRYKGTPIDPETVGGELGVDAVVLGHVVQRADNIALTAELVNVGDGTLLWSEQYSRRVADVLLVQEDLAREISKALRGRLTPGEETRLTRRYTEDAEAYQAYLQGRHHIRTRTEESFRLSAEYFERAIDHDPSYALAHSGMADALSLLGHYTYDPPAEAYRKARKAALQALELDDRLAEAHTSLAWIDSNECRWREAEAGFQRALELEPSYATGPYLVQLLFDDNRETRRGHP